MAAFRVAVGKGKVGVLQGAERGIPPAEDLAGIKGESSTVEGRRRASE